MTMTLKEALTLKLPNGKTLGEASPQDWNEAVEFFTKEHEHFKDIDPATITAEDSQRLLAIRASDLHKALQVIKENHPEGRDS
jgi:hypothetical protein